MPAGQQQPKGDEGSLDFLWTIVLVIAIVLIVWYFGKSYIAAAIYYLKLAEITLIQFVISFWDKPATLLHLPIIDTSKITNWANLIRLKEVGPDIDTLIKVNTDVGVYMRFPLIVLLLLMAAKIYFKNITLKFKKTFSMDSLKAAEKINWPKIKPVVDLDLVHTDIKEGPWAMSLTPLEFCKRHQLINEVHKNGKTIAELREGKASQILALQLGQPWTGYLNKMPVHMQVMFAIFATKANGDQDAVDKMLEQIATSAASGNLDFSGYKPLLKKYSQTKAVIKVMQGHAYILTMMASMLELARTTGVLAVAEFLWLKAIDRKLWYVLNSVGRQTATAEVAGIFSHWLAEKALKGAVRTPMLDEAIRGFKEALTEVLYEPDEEG